jgi:hypothetical protein
VIVRDGEAALASVDKDGGHLDGEEGTVLQNVEEDMEYRDRCGLKRRSPGGSIGNGACLWRRE